MAYSLAPPAIRPLRALPPLLALVMAPSIPWRAIFSVDPSFHPLWEAISWMARFPTIPSSSNSRFLSSTFVLSKISLSFFKLSSVFLFSFSMSCFWFSLSVIVICAADTADFVVLPAYLLLQAPFYLKSPLMFNIIPFNHHSIANIQIISKSIIYIAILEKNLALL